MFLYQLRFRLTEILNLLTLLENCGLSSFLEMFLVFESPCQYFLFFQPSLLGTGTPSPFFIFITTPSIKSVFLSDNVNNVVG